jgi:hypothetical protein
MELVKWVLTKFNVTKDFGIKKYFEESTTVLSCDADYKIKNIIWKLRNKMQEKVLEHKNLRLPKKAFGQGVTNIVYKLDNGHILKTALGRGHTIVLGEAILQTVLHYPDYRSHYQTILNGYMKCLNTNPAEACLDYPIPDVYDIFWSCDKIYFEYEFIPEILQDAKLNRDDFMDILYQICIHLMILQDTINFMHRDNHPGNMAVKKRPIPKQMQYTYESKSVRTTSRYQIYFIDLETACLNFSNIKISGSSMHGAHRYYNTCNNNSFDMHIFLSWAYVTRIIPIDVSHVRKIAKESIKQLKLDKCRSKKCMESEFANTQRRHLNIANIPYLYPSNILYALIHQNYRLNIYEIRPLFKYSNKACKLDECKKNRHCKQNT